MAYEDLFKYIGDFGRYQKRIYFLLCLTAIPCGFHKLANVFLMAKPDHRCQLPFESINANYSLPNETWYMSYPVDEFNHEKYSGCERLDANFTDEYFASNSPVNKSITCVSYILDDSKYKSSTVIEWNMICGRKAMRATADALFMLGVLLGSIVFGQMSDKYGRKPVFFASLVLQVIFGVIAGIAPDYITFVLARLVVGATTSGVFLVSYVLAMEMVGQSYRLFAGVAVMMFFSLGFILTAGFAYIFRDWREFQIAITLPGLVFMCYYWFIPESSRWLLSKNRKDEAIKVIEAVAKENKAIIPKEVLDSIDDEIKPKQIVKEPDVKEPSLLDLFRYPNLRRKTLLIFLDWFVNSATYYGLSWNTSNLGGNDYVNFIISGAVEFPAYTFLLLTLNRWGRRNILCGCMLVAGTMLLTTILIPKEHDTAIMVLAMLGKMAITSSYGTVYVFTTEQFPTPVRNVGLGASSMMARFGGILAPYINVLADLWKPFPLVIFGVLAFISGLLSLYLPETLNKKLPETIEEGERFGKKTAHQDEENADNLEELKKLNQTSNTIPETPELINGHAKLDN
ncbi:organic cation transporter protein [Contarinia nasturtii]|uniref:organic cation transporter protein n=1 Tax=Contarinia nasturtii TaxID=265458 RepID=UPI0012D44816|nr:organic cation transporter protein [Contarinia nasturtii]